MSKIFSEEVVKNMALLVGDKELNWYEFEEAFASEVSYWIRHGSPAHEAEEKAWSTFRWWYEQPLKLDEHGFQQLSTLILNYRRGAAWIALLGMSHDRL